MSKKSKVAVYIRVSTDQQGKGADSQRKEIESYLEGHNIEGVRWYEDRLSGKNTKRPEFQRMQKDIFQGKVKMVICWSLDRLSRSLRDGINTLSDWLEKEVRVVCVAQQFDLSGPAGELVAAVLFSLAQMERKAISENVKRGLAAAKKRGVKLGKRPSIKTKELRELVSSGMGVSAIAKRLKRSRQGIYKALEREGIALQND